MNGRRWYYARIRWAVMVQGKEGLRRWEEAVHIFPSEDRASAFRRALDIGHQRQSGHVEGRRRVETKLAQILTLDCFAADQTEFEVRLESKRPTERLPFEYVFDPKGTDPAPFF